jgi:hypothetical protein
LCGERAVSAAAQKQAAMSSAPIRAQMTKAS